MNRATQTSYDREDLLACARGETFGPGNAQLPYPPMLMFDRITHIDAEGGTHGKGCLTAEFDIRRDQWFFDCHFIGDPVEVPGCLGLDAMWQLVGFFLGWSGAQGRGRALGVGEVKFTGQVTPAVARIVYRIEFKRVILKRKLWSWGWPTKGSWRPTANLFMRRGTSRSACSTPPTWSDR